MPITKDLNDFIKVSGLSNNLARSHLEISNINKALLQSQQPLGAFAGLVSSLEDDDECDGEECALDVDEAVEMKGIDKEQNDMERTVAHNLLRRSVVRKKLNWSQQFTKGWTGGIGAKNERINSVKKTF